MARGRKPRTWVKMDCEGLLRGSINYLLPLDGQAVWLKMIALSEISGGRPGYIEDNNQNGLPLEYIAYELHCSQELLELVLEKMRCDGAVDILSSGSVHLVNFDHYQFTEYDRQKPYRQAKQEAGEKIPKVCDACGHKEVTSEKVCPKCNGEMKRDYTGGKHGHMVRK